VTTVSQLEGALALAGISSPARWHDRVGSTNAEAVLWAEAGAEELSLVAAGHQTAGRGREGRGWEDVPGGALMFSFVLRPRLVPEDAGVLPLLAGAAAAEAAAAVVGVEVRCKWPNDLMRGDAKTGGILAESALDGAAIRHVVMGVGINLVPPDGVPGAAGLGVGVDPMELLSEMLRRFLSSYVDGGSAPGFADDVRARWRAVAATLGRDVEVARVGGDPIRGRAVDVDRRGGLVLDIGDGGRVTVSTGEVEHVR
jgi:BirA family biotin operon repressor/biotin-[acetyl-CoA-carboxylase] ligase